jgi:hypothetical protein
MGYYRMETKTKSNENESKMTLGLENGNASMVLAS